MFGWAGAAIAAAAIAGARASAMFQSDFLLRLMQSSCSGFLVRPAEPAGVCGFLPQGHPSEYGCLGNHFGRYATV